MLKEEAPETSRGLVYEQSGPISIRSSKEKR